jgi:hypothetical protein
MASNSGSAEAAVSDRRNCEPPRGSELVLHDRPFTRAAMQSLSAAQQGLMAE